MYLFIFTMEIKGIMERKYSNKNMNMSPFIVHKL